MSDINKTLAKIELSDEQQKTIMELSGKTNIPSLAIVELSAADTKQLSSNLLTARALVVCW